MDSTAAQSTSEATKAVAQTVRPGIAAYFAWLIAVPCAIFMMAGYFLATATPPRLPLAWAAIIMAFINLGADLTMLIRFTWKIPNYLLPKDELASTLEHDRAMTQGPIGPQTVSVADARPEANSAAPTIVTTAPPPTIAVPVETNATPPNDAAPITAEPAAPAGPMPTVRSARADATAVAEPTSI